MKLCDLSMLFITIYTVVVELYLVVTSGYYNKADVHIVITLGICHQLRSDVMTSSPLCT